MNINELIRILICLEKAYGNKPVMFNTGDGVFRSIVSLREPGLFNYVGDPPKNRDNGYCIFMDLDFC